MKPSHSLLLSCLLTIALAQASSAWERPHLVRQATTSGQGTEATTTTVATGTTTTGGQQTTTTQQQQTTTSPTTTTQQTTTQEQTTTTQQTTTSTTNQQQTTTTTSENTSTTGTTTAQATTTNQQTTTQNNAQSTQTAEVQTTESVSTNNAGEAVTITITSTNTKGSQSETASSSSASSSSSGSSSSTSSSSSSGVSTGTIIGLSVAGGVALLGIIGFIAWKLTRKRFSDFDDSEAIKWPELNAHGSDGGDSHPLPVHSTGRAGFDTGSEVSLSRAPSTSTNNFSTPDLTHNDPYAVPPLPHLNPNQPIPYRDDPNANAYYDPYRGPVPNTFNDAPPGSEWSQGEAIPMTQMTGAGRMSPGPGLAYADTGRASPTLAGRASPGPSAALRTKSPAPTYGRASPGPQAAFDPYAAR
ncbi:uncharacterized protein BT62DRAFT_1071949 [Guyanagaster necrorhizus]|uniref:Uncharacterized protein n=1 Tax=Guyanagaster necrorhizus TaxID=856835 RepID=A0A9P7W2U1_9AGAR|nr:uncharacterized protein BT62DRAFT_1071949 [Guyanagaster necrorhizus MCA 3950]KAG7451375.1 hypothetical protein BT62DRAFT_1071949 [Guyanagaster necrorhizus MCA 3950]